MKFLASIPIIACIYSTIYAMILSFSNPLFVFWVIGSAIASAILIEVFPSIVETFKEIQKIVYEKED